MDFTLFIFWTIVYLTRSTKLELKVYEIDSEVKEMIWCGNNKDVLFALTEKKALYKSSTKGLSWKKLNDILLNEARDKLRGYQEQIGTITRIVKSSADPNMIFIVGSHGINWISENCGDKISAINFGRPIQEIMLHPVKRDWMIATTFSICAEFDDNNCKVYKELVVSTDLSKTWRVIAKYVVQVDWGYFTSSSSTATESEEADNIPYERILLTYDPKGRGSQKISSVWNYKVDFVYSDDFFTTMNIGIRKGNKFLLTKHYLFVAQVIDQEQQEVSLQISNSKMKSYKFQQLHLIDSNKDDLLKNPQLLKDNSFSILDTTENSVFISIIHFGMRGPFGNIYVSDLDGIKYTLSFPYNLHSENSLSDFSRVENLDGVYIANGISIEYINENLETLNLKEHEEVEEQINHQVGYRQKSFNTRLNNLILESKNYIKTFISFNKGASWTRIKAPVTDTNGERYDCGEFCYLNLFGMTSQHPPYYSVDKAVGLIIGNGSVGEYLNNDADPSEISLFLSNNGGGTYKEIQKGSHVYEIGDNGGLIVAISSYLKVNILLYTLDQGKSWEEYEFYDKKIYVKNVIMSPSPHGKEFIIYGNFKKKSDEAGVIVSVDFSNLKVDICKNPLQPNSKDSDYETWNPSNVNIIGEAANGQAKPDKCLMGVLRTYVRKKSESVCFNVENLEKFSTTINCQCTDEDYECDYGFQKRITEDGNSSYNCVKITFNKEEEDKELQITLNECVGYYSLSQGYRKIPGNQCKGGVNYDPILVPCSNQIFFSKFGVIIFITLLLVLIILIYGACTIDFVIPKIESEEIRSEITALTRSGYRASKSKFYDLNSEDTTGSESNYSSEYDDTLKLNID